MARTHRKHLSRADLAKQGGKDKDREARPFNKPHKQRRANERAKIRKEYL